MEFSLGSYTETKIYILMYKIACSEITQHFPNKVLNFSCSTLNKCPLGHLNNDITLSEWHIAESATRKNVFYEHHVHVHSLDIQPSNALFFC